MSDLKDNLFQKEELFSVAFNRACDFIVSKRDLGIKAYRSWFFNDEPKLFSYNVDLNCLVKNPLANDDGMGSGTDLIPKVALMKALGESIERLCLCTYDEKQFIKSSYKNIKNQAIDILKLRNFSESQLVNKNFLHYLFDDNSVFSWIKGYSLRDNKEILIPAQLVYVPYEFGNELCIRDPITTGAAASTSLGGAIYRGLCEIVERDAFMITYLNKLSQNNIDLNRHKELKNMKELCERYNLELKVVNISTDIGVSTMMGVIIDKTGIGPAVSFGLSSDLDPVIAAIGAANESFHSRPWIRSEMIKQNYNKTTDELVKRGLYWSNPNMINKCDFLFKNKKYKNIKQKYKSKYNPKKLKEILKLFNNLGYDVCFVEVTIPDIRKIGFRVVKVVVPDLHPLYLDDDHPYLSSKRLFEVPKKIGYKNSTKLNNIPHPFL